MIARTSLIAAALLSGSMAMANPLSGTWDCEGRTSRTEAMRLLLKFRPSGALRHQANFARLKNDERVDFSITVTGSWKFTPRKLGNGRTGGTLYETMRNVKMTGIKVDKQDAMNTPVGKFMRKMVPSFMMGRKTPFQSKVVFHGPNKMTLNSGKTKNTCVKRK